MLRFLQDIARSAANYIHPPGIEGAMGGTDPTTTNTASAQIVDTSYTDKYSSKLQRGFAARQRFGTDTWESIQTTQQKAHRLIVEGKPLPELQTILQGCSQHITEVINIRDMLGYNLLQYAIITNRVDVVRFLILQGADLNLPICARPLHLAAKLGRAKIIQLLLDCGADPDVMSCVCYPESHILQRTMFVSDSECWSVACFGDIYAQDKMFRVQFEYPLYYAIMADSIECVLLLTKRAAGQLSSRSPKLHTACFFGAFQCMKHFLKVNPAELSLPDHKGLFPLQYAVQWGKRFAEYLVLKGALVTVKTTHRESLLMLLYSQSKFIRGLSETSAYLLDCGLKMTVNAVDAGGNSPLHALFRKLHKSPPAWSDNPRATPLGPRKDSSEDTTSLCQSFSGACMTKTTDFRAFSSGFYKDVALSAEENEYLDSVMILLRAGANTNLANKVGNTCLHDLLKIQTADPMKISNRPRHCSLRLVYCILSVVFEHGANPRFVNNMHVTTHGCLITSGTDVIFHRHDDPFVLADKTELDFLIRSIWLVKEHGCNFTTNCATVPLQHLLTKLDLMERLPTQHDLTESVKSDLASGFTKQIMLVLEAMFGCGVPPSDLQGMYYQLMNHYAYLPTEVIKDAILLFLHFGADPNIGGVHIPMSVFRSRSAFSHCPVYPLLHLLNLLGKNETDKGLLDLFDVFFNAMEESGAKQCMFHYLSYDSNNNNSAEDLPVLKSLQTQVHSVMVTPKTLRQIASQFVYVKLCLRLKSRVCRLPLPNTLKNVLLSMQY